MLIASFISLGKEIQRAAEAVALGNGMFLNLNDQIKQLLQVLESRFTREIDEEELVIELYTYLVEITGFVRKQATLNYIVRLFNAEKTFKRVQMYESELHGRIMNLQLLLGTDQSTVKSLAQRQETVMSNLQISHEKDMAELKKLIVTCLAENKTVEEKMIGMKIQGNSYVETMNFLSSSESTSIDLPEATIEGLGAVKRKLQVLSQRSIIPVREITTILESDLIYESESPFGFGSFGVVFKAKMIKDGRLVAIKKANDNVRDDSLIKTILKEAKVWKDLNHENVIPLLGLNLNTDKPFLVMPYMKNGSVYSYLCANPETSVEMRINFMTHTSAGLAYLHEKGIVHGDIKPDNLLLDENLNCLITDFGMARAKLGTTSSKPNISGALRFSAPEKSQPGFASNEATDMFAFAMTFYQVLTGLIPFEEESDQFLVYSWIKDGHRPNAKTELIPPIVFDLISGAWAQSPTERPEFKCVSVFLEAFRLKRPLSIDSKSTVREDHTTISENIGIASKKEKSPGMLKSIRGLSNRAKYAVVLAILLFAIGITIGIIFGTKAKSSSKSNNSSSPSAPATPRTNITQTGPSSGTGSAPSGIKVAAVTAGMYYLGQVDCFNYRGTDCEIFCVQNYGVALQSSTNTITANQNGRSPPANCACDPLTAENGIGQYFGQVFAIAPSASTAYVLLGSSDQGCNLTYHLSVANVARNGDLSSKGSFTSAIIIAFLLL